MKKMISLKRSEARRVWGSYAFVALCYLVLKGMTAGHALSSAMRGMLVPICAYAVMAVSLNLVVGILGELSLGHAGFMSVGAFSGVACSILLQPWIPFGPLRLVLSLLCGATFAGAAGFLIGIPVLRLRGDYLAIVTLAFGEIIKSLLNNFYFGVDQTGLHLSMLKDATGLLKGGRMIINGPMGIGGIRKIATFGAGTLLLLLALVIVYDLCNSRWGRAFMAIRDDRIAAESVGIDITRFKMTAFVISAALAGAAGALFAQNYSTVVANKFDFNTSILILVFVVLGGQGNLMGSIIAAAVLTVLPEKLRNFRDYRMLIYAVTLIGIMLVTNNATLRDFFSRINPASQRGRSRRSRS